MTIALTNEDAARNQAIIWHGAFVSWLDARQEALEAEAAQLRTRVYSLAPVTASALSLIDLDAPGLDLRKVNQGALAMAVDYARLTSKLMLLEADLRLIDSYLPIARLGYRIEDEVDPGAAIRTAAIVRLWETFWAECPDTSGAD